MVPTELPGQTHRLTLDAVCKKLIMKKTSKIRWPIFLIPWFLIVATIVLNLINDDAFNTVILAIIDFILSNFDWLFALMAFICVVLVVVAYFSPFGNVRIGGSKARPIINQTNYVWIVLCTVLAAGILMWACAEPMYHYYSPPSSVTPESSEAITFAIKNIFLEWTFTPMCIYAMPSILFAFLFYNAKKEYSVSSMMYPCLSEKTSKRFSPVVNCICLFALVCGMASSMGMAIFMVSDGLTNASGGRIQSSLMLWVIIAAAIVVVFVISAISGILKGIRILSTTNAWIYICLGIFVLIFGPTTYILQQTVEGFGAYLGSFFQMSLFLSAADGDGWATAWPIFYWCVWMAWMPVSAVFLGRISKGYSVKEMIRTLVVIPGLFSVAWLGLFSSSSIYYELDGRGINDALVANGTAAASYAILDQLPIPIITTIIFLVIAFISYVTCSDSNTTAMAGLCTKGITTEETESPNWIKFVWGVTVGAFCIIFLRAFQSTDGIKNLSYLGGFPIVFLLIIISISFVRVVRDPKKYDVHQEDYDETGRPIPSERLKSEQDELKEQKKGAGRFTGRGNRSPTDTEPGEAAAAKASEEASGP